MSVSGDGHPIVDSLEVTDDCELDSIGRVGDDDEFVEVWAGNMMAVLDVEEAREFRDGLDAALADPAEATPADD